MFCAYSWNNPGFSHLGLQKVVLATDFVVYCGWDRIASGTFLGMLETITLFKLDRFITGSSDSDLTYCIYRGVLIDKYWKAWQTNSPETAELRPSLLELVINNRPAKCSDPRDRLFAFLGMSSGTVLSDLPPDSGETVDKTYLRAAQYFIGTGDGAALLNQASTVRRSLSLPSWVPDWDAPLGPDSQVLAQPRFVTYISKIFTTGGDGEKLMRVGESANALLVRGFIFDIVSVLGAPAPEIGTLISPTQLIRMVEELGSMLSRLSQQYPSGEDIDDVWWRTCVCDRNSALDWKAPDEYREHLHLWQIISSWESAAEEEDFEQFRELSNKLAPYFPDCRLPGTYEGFQELKDRTAGYQIGCLHHFCRWGSDRHAGS
jgi:hypothetical protein